MNKQEEHEATIIDTRIPTCSPSKHKRIMGGIVGMSGGCGLVTSTRYS